MARAARDLVMGLAVVCLAGMSLCIFSVWMLAFAPGVKDGSGHPLVIAGETTVTSAVGVGLLFLAICDRKRGRIWRPLASASGALITAWPVLLLLLLPIALLLADLPRAFVTLFSLRS